MPKLSKYSASKLASKHFWTPFIKELDSIYRNSHRGKPEVDLFINLPLEASIHHDRKTNKHVAKSWMRNHYGSVQTLQQMKASFSQWVRWVLYLNCGLLKNLGIQGDDQRPHCDILFDWLFKKAFGGSKTLPILGNFSGWKIYQPADFHPIRLEILDIFTENCSKIQNILSVIKMIGFWYKNHHEKFWVDAIKSEDNFWKIMRKLIKTSRGA